MNKGSTINGTITIKGRTFTYEHVVYDYKMGSQTLCKDYYLLTGKRGATYGALRHIETPNRMHVIHSRGKSARFFDDVRLTDEFGSLQVVGQ